MRVIAGKFKGSTLYLPNSSITRPLKDRARESIFNILIHSNKIDFSFENSNVLDLYSGSGSFGIECLSREVKKVCFVENNKHTLEILKKNCKKFNLKKNFEILKFDVFKILKKNIIKEKYNLIFSDPPFKDNNTYDLINLIYKNNFLKKEGILIIHRDRTSNDQFPLCFKVLDERIYGLSKIIFGKF